MNKQELRAKILATANPKPTPLKNMPEWGDVYVKRLTVGEVESLSSDIDPKLRSARGVARVLCDANGERLFDPASVEDLFAINSLPSESLNRISEAMEAGNATSAEAAIDLGNVSPPVTGSSST